MIRDIKNPGMARTAYSSIQGYSEILMLIQPHSQACEWGRLPLLSFEYRKKSTLILNKNTLIGVHLWVKIFIQNKVLIVSKGNNSKMSPCGTFFLVFLAKCLWNCPSTTKPPALKNFWLHACTQALLFLQNASS